MDPSRVVGKTINLEEPVSTFVQTKVYAYKRVTATMKVRRLRWPGCGGPAARAGPALSFARRHDHVACTFNLDLDHRHCLRLFCTLGRSHSHSQPRTYYT